MGISFLVYSIFQFLILFLTNRVSKAIKKEEAFLSLFLIKSFGIICTILPWLTWSYKNFDFYAADLGCWKNGLAMVTYDGNIVLYAFDLLLFVYFLVVVIVLIRNLDRLNLKWIANTPNKMASSLSGLAMQWHSLSINEKPHASRLVLVLEFFWIMARAITWFQPGWILIDSQLNMLQKKLELSVSIKISKHSWANIITLLTILFALVSFIPWFSFVLNRNSSINKIESKASMVLFDYHKFKKGTVLEWGQLDMSVLNIDSIIQPQSFRATLINAGYFYKYLSNKTPKFYFEGEKTNISNVDILFCAADLKQPILTSGLSQWKQYSNALSKLKELTIYLKIKDQKGRQWFTCLAISGTGNLYYDSDYYEKLLSWNSRLIKPKIETEAGLYDIIENDDTLYEASIWTLNWGKQQIFISKYANPNLYSGFNNMNIDSAQTLANTPIQLLKNGKPVKIKSFNFNIYNNNEYTPQAVPIFQEDILVNNLQISKLNIQLHKIQHGAVLALQLFTEEIEVRHAIIKINDPFEPYYARYIQEYDMYDSLLYPFQVVQLPGQKSLLKLDTNLVVNRSLLDLYSDTTKYAIRHFDNFKTKNRLLTKDNFFEYDAILESSKQIEKVLNNDELPIHPKHTVWLLWGKERIPSTIKYLPQEKLITKQAEPISIYFNGQFLNIESFDFTIKPLNQEPINHTRIVKYGQVAIPQIQYIDNQSTIVFQNIIISLNKKKFYFPIQFTIAISSGYDQSLYKLKIQDSSNDHKDSSTANHLQWTDQSPYRWQCTHCDLKTLIAYLYRYNNPNRINFIGSSDSDTLGVTFESKHINLAYGTNIIRNNLSNRYHFYTRKSLKTLPSYRLGIDNTYKLQNFILPNYKRNTQSPHVQTDDLGRTILERGTLDDLTDLIESKYNVFIHNVSRDTNQYYISLPLDSDFETTKKSLEEDYGLYLGHGNYNVPMLDVFFFDPN